MRERHALFTRPDPAHLLAKLSYDLGAELEPLVWIAQDVRELLADDLFDHRPELLGCEFGNGGRHLVLLTDISASLDSIL